LLRYSDSDLRQALDKLPRDHRVGFAAACAQRLLPRYVMFYAKLGNNKPNDGQVMSTSLDLLWRDLSGARLRDEEIADMIDRVLAVMPHEDTALEANEPYATDAAASVAFALQARLTGESKFAISAARRIYHALDNFVINNLFGRKSVLSNVDEEIVLAHPLIQHELARQHRDLDNLRSALNTAPSKAKVLSELRKLAEEQSSRVFIV